MNVHKNARLTPRGRDRILRQVESGQTPGAVIVSLVFRAHEAEPSDAANPGRAADFAYGEILFD